jgi:hypothetical protein
MRQGGAVVFIEIATACMFSIGSTVAHASATARDYDKCHDLAALVLRQCLNRSSGYHDDGSCWVKARKEKDGCYEEVRSSYSPNIQRQKAAEEERLRLEFEESRRREVEKARK